jgi:hypothetical protein
VTSGRQADLRPLQPSADDSRPAGLHARSRTPDAAARSFPLAVALIAGTAAAAAVWVLTGRRPRGGDGRLVVQSHHPDGASGTCSEYASVPLELSASQRSTCPSRVPTSPAGSGGCLLRPSSGQRPVSVEPAPHQVLGLADGAAAGGRNRSPLT